jgi:hypothetical protein
MSGSPPNPPDRRPRQAGALCHRRPGPVGGIFRCLLQRGGHHSLDLVQQDRQWLARPGSSTSPPIAAPQNRPHLATVCWTAPSLARRLVMENISLRTQKLS